MNTCSTQKQELIALCATSYFTALFNIGMGFTATGEEILAYPGCRDLHWAKSLFAAIKPISKLLSSNHFPKEQKSNLRVLKALAYASDEEISELLSREIVAIFCLADNVLAALYHEYILYQQYTILAKHTPVSKEDAMTIRQLRWTASKFRKIKKNFLKIAFGGNLDMAQRMGLEAEFIGSRTSILHDALVAAPIIYRYCPRYLTSDWSQITKLRKKYRDRVYYCESKMEIPDPDFEVMANGKF